MKKILALSTIFVVHHSILCFKHPHGGGKSIGNIVKSTRSGTTKTTSRTQSAQQHAVSTISSTAKKMGKNISSTDKTKLSRIPKSQLQELSDMNKAAIVHLGRAAKDASAESVIKGIDSIGSKISSFERQVDSIEQAADNAMEISGKVHKYLDKIGTVKLSEVIKRAEREIKDAQSCTCLHVEWPDKKQLSALSEISQFTKDKSPTQRCADVCHPGYAATRSDFCSVLVDDIADNVNTNRASLKAELVLMKNKIANGWKEFVDTQNELDEVLPSILAFLKVLKQLVPKTDQHLVRDLGELDRAGISQLQHVAENTLTFLVIMGRIGNKEKSQLLNAIPKVNAALIRGSHKRIGGSNMPKLLTVLQQLEDAHNTLTSAGVDLKSSARLGHIVDKLSEKSICGGPLSRAQLRAKLGVTKPLINVVEYAGSEYRVRKNIAKVIDRIKARLYITEPFHLPNGLPNVDKGTSPRP